MYYGGGPITVKTGSKVTSETLSKTLAPAYPKEEIVGAELLDCNLKNGIYLASVKVQLKGKVAQTSTLHFDDSTKDLTLHKVENGQTIKFAIGHVTKPLAGHTWDGPVKELVDKMKECAHKQV